jgi:hypothetical protein
MFGLELLFALGPLGLAGAAYDPETDHPINPGPDGYG